MDVVLTKECAACGKVVEVQIPFDEALGPQSPYYCYECREPQKGICSICKHEEFIAYTDRDGDAVCEICATQYQFS